MFKRLILSLLLLCPLLVTTGCGKKKVTDAGDDYFVQGMKVINSDQAKAIDLFTKAIDTKPTHWCYYNRGLLYAKQGEDAKAKADVAEGLKLVPDSGDLKWLGDQLKKPKAKRKLDKPPANTK